MKTTTVALFFIASALTPTAGVGATTSATAPDPNYVPCRVHKNAIAIFPIRLLEQGIIRGEVTVVLEVDTSGKVIDQLVTSYSHPDFAAQATHALKRWTFDPGIHKGEPVASIVKVNFEFTVNGVVVYEKRFDTLLDHDAYPNRYAYFAHGIDSLDEKPVAINLSAPVYPREWANEGRHGSVVVRFYIDEAGQARLPVITAKSDDYLASAAIAAVKQWRFKPPMMRGRPVLAYAEQLFVFEPPSAQQPDNKS